jgi:alpha-glucosidase (family GH31 glycosyl hydrolase)
MPPDNFGSLTTTTSLVRLEPLAGGAIRVTHVRRGTPQFPPDPVWLPAVLAHIAPAAAKEAAWEGIVHAGRITLTHPDLPAGFSEPRPPAWNGRRANLFFPFQADERLYGGGEWFNAFERQSGRMRLEARESPAFLQGRQTYSPIPFFISSRGYGFFFLSAYPTEWHLNRRKGWVRASSRQPVLDYFLIPGPDFQSVLRRWMSLVGRPPLPPRWAFGLMGTSYPQEPQARVVAMAEEHRRREIPLDTIILDYHWEERFHNFLWRKSLFPHPDDLQRDLADRNVRLGLILTPFINQKNLPFQKFLLQKIAQDIPVGLETDDESVPDLYAEGVRKGYFAHDRASWWFGAGGMVDFTNPDASAWWHARMQPLYAAGAAFFKNDDGEYLPSGATSHLGLDPAEHHNLYGFFYGKALYENMQTLDDRRPFIYARSVWAGSQRYPAIFLGDQHPTFENIRRSLRAGLNMSLAGFAYWTADILGLDGRTTPETHMRYTQWAMFVPVARYFWRPAAIDATRFPWSHGAGVEENFKLHAQLRYRLLPTYQHLAWEAYLTGMPILRPLVLEFGWNPRWANVYQQVMLGSALMLCPAAEPNQRQVRVVLPEGAWHDFWSSASYAGGEEVTIPAPMERLPILVRGGRPLWMGPALQCIPDSHTFTQVELHLWPPYPCEADFYDEDGVTRAYITGTYQHIHVSVTNPGGELCILLENRAGLPADAPMTRQLTFQIHHFTGTSNVSVQGATHQNWHSDTLENCLSIEVEWDQIHPIQIRVPQPSSGPAEQGISIGNPAGI